jgi:hypothetical protein
MRGFRCGHVLLRDSKKVDKGRLTTERPLRSRAKYGQNYSRLKVGSQRSGEQELIGKCGLDRDNGKLGQVLAC